MGDGVGVGMLPWDESAVMQMPWRVGRSVGRTIYAQTGPSPSKRDRLIGVMDTSGLAESVVIAHNHPLGESQGSES